MKRIAAALSALMLLVTMCMMSGCAQQASNPADVTQNDAISVTEVSSISGSEDLVGKTIGVQLGTTGCTMAEDIENATIDKYSKAADAIEALRQGKVDAVIIDSAPAKYFVEKNPDLSILPEPFAVEEYAMAVKKGNSDLTAQLNSALDQLRENGTLDEINQNWLVDEEYGKHPYTSPEGTTYDGKRRKRAENSCEKQHDPENSRKKLFRDIRPGETVEQAKNSPEMLKVRRAKAKRAYSSSAGEFKVVVKEKA